MIEKIDKRALPAIDLIIRGAETRLSSLIGSPVSLKIKMDENMMNKQQLDIVLAICNVFGVHWEDIVAKSRKNHIKEARHAFCWCMRKYTKFSYKDIGFEIDRDHTTVINSCQVVRDWIDANDPGFMPKLLQLQTILNPKDETETETEQQRAIGLGEPAGCDLPTVPAGV